MNRWMHDASDLDLLRQYADGNSDTAFAALVSRHVNLVYSAALRKTGKPHAAEEITQAVFIILAKKARALRRETVLPGWLYQAARLTAANFLRNEIRRVRREQEAYMQSLSNETVAWPHLEPLLDDAMGRLNEKERNAIVQRFFEGKSFQEIGVAFGGSENAAKKRVIRGLEKLRRFFLKRGVDSSAATIAGAISANSVQVAPVALAKAVTAIAVTKGAAASISTLTLIKGALKIMAWTKAKTAIVAGVAAIVGIGATTVVVKALLPVPDIQGTWAGTVPLSESGVQAGESPKSRFVMRIVKVNGSYQVSGDDIDRGLKDVSVSNFTYKDRHIHAEISGTPDSFDGTVNLAGTKVSGEWKEGKDTGPLVFTRTANPPAFPEPLTDAEFAPRAGSDLQGLWKGMIRTGNGGLHVNVKIAELADGTFRADFYSVDQDGNRLPTSVSYDGTTVKIMPMAGYGMFQGELRNDGKEMAGSWIQGGRWTPTTFTRAN